MSNGAEVERLRARIAELESQLGGHAPAVEEYGRDRSFWRAPTSAVLLVLACVLAPLSVTAAWASSELSDTEQYVETVAPLAENSLLRRAIANEVTAAVIDGIELEQVATETVDALAVQENVPPRVAAALPALVGPITQGVTDFTRTQVNNILATPQFAQVWEQVNRVAHSQVLRLLEGEQGGVVSAQGDTITLNLAPIIAQVKERLVAQGFTLAENIPVVDRSFVLVQSEAISQAQGFYSLLNTLGVWLSVVALLLFATGVYLARGRRRALLRGALGVAGAMVVVGAGLTIFRLTYVEGTPADILTPAAAGSVFDTLVRFLRTGLRAAAVLALIVALAAFLTGPSTPAVRTRSGLRRGFASLRGSAESAGWSSGAVGPWVQAHKRALQIGVLAAGGIMLMFWTTPTVATVVTIACLVLVLLAAVEFLARPGQPTPATSAGSATSAGATGPPATSVPAPREPSEVTSATEPVPPG